MSICVSKYVYVFMSVHVPISMYQLSSTPNSNLREKTKLYFRTRWPCELSQYLNLLSYFYYVILKNKIKQAQIKLRMTFDTLIPE